MAEVLQGVGRMMNPGRATPPYRGPAAEIQRTTGQPAFDPAGIPTASPTGTPGFNPNEPHPMSGYPSGATYPGGGGVPSPAAGGGEMSPILRYGVPALKGYLTAIGPGSRWIGTTGMLSRGGLAALDSYMGMPQQQAQTELAKAKALEARTKYDMLKDLSPEERAMVMSGGYGSLAKSRRNMMGNRALAESLAATLPNLDPEQRRRATMMIHALKTNPASSPDPTKVMDTVMGKHEDPRMRELEARDMAARIQERKARREYYTKGGSRGQRTQIEWTTDPADENFEIAVRWDPQRERFVEATDPITGLPLRRRAEEGMEFPFLSGYGRRRSGGAESSAAEDVPEGWSVEIE